MKQVPFSRDLVEEIAQNNPTPFYVYDEQGIRNQVRKLNSAFSWNYGFRNYFAVKATPNPAILKIMKEEGCGLDVSSLVELMMAEKAGFTGHEIMFTGNNTPAEEFKKAYELGAITNLDDVGLVDYLKKSLDGEFPETICFRYNPGPRLQDFNDIIGKPQEAKFGVAHEQVFAAYRAARKAGAKTFGLHTMVVSNERSVKAFARTAYLLFDLALELRYNAGIPIAFLNLGGGIGIPYHPDEEEINIEEVSANIAQLYQDKVVSLGHYQFPLFLECGRYITGPHGYLVTKVRHLKDTYKKYAQVDATMADLMRPGMYGAYHHISVIGKHSPQQELYDVTGSLCENNDKFAIDRLLPQLDPDDVLVIHDAGAHGRAMGFNYNGRLRCGEFLLKEDNSWKKIRRAETPDDYLSTFQGF